MAQMNATDAATELTQETPLADLVSPQAAAASEITLKIIEAIVVSYAYNWKGKEVTTKKLVCTMVSENPQQYCLGIVKLQAKNDTELAKHTAKYTKGTTWKFSKMKYHEGEKPQWINTSNELRSCAVL